MASAVLASRNETHWGERKVYMRKTPNSANLNPKSNPNPKKSIVDLSDNFHGRHADELVAPSEDSSSFNRKPIGVSHRKDYVTFNVASYTRRELKELKRRLLSELEQVRSLASRINSREFQPRSVYSSSQSYGGINWPPPPLKIPAIDSPLGGRSDGSREKRTPKTNSYYRGSEFVTGKEKFSPVEQKKASGFKRAPSPLTPGRDLKKTAGSSDAGMKSCRHILTKMWKHKDCWIFLSPVDAEKLGLHDYHQIIKYPMDLGTVKRKLEKKLYSSPLDFASDVRLTFNNALKYNPKGHDVNTWAEKLLGWFDEMFAPVARRALSVEEEVHPSSWSQAPPPESIRKPQAPPVAAPVHTPVVQSQSQDPVQTSRASAGGRAFPRKQPKPKAKDPNKREMSFEEKQKLSMDLQNLPQEKMDQVVQIIRKRNSNLSQHGDEIELDIEAVDKETLWELDRFVSNCKKMMSKIKRQAQTTHHKAETSISREENKSSIGEIPGGYAKTTKKVVETGDEDVDIGEEMPSTNFPPVVIERDKDTGYASRSSSSSSSSSGSSSSSSDSDSGSSSSSDSDGGDEAQSPFDKSKASPRS